MKKIFIAAVEEENDKYCAYVIPVKTGENIKHTLAPYKKCIVWHLCESRKQAYDLVNMWNASYKRNGTYMFSSPAF